jgi:choline-glycine betaine transporter
MSKESTTTTHNPRDYKFRLSVSIIPLAIFLAILVAGIVMPDTFKRIVDNAVMVVMKDFGWFISLSTLFFLVFCLSLLFLPVGNIRLGGPKSKPDLSTFEYFALSLCAGMASGFILWPTAEMIEYTSFPPRVFGVEPGSYQSVVDALKFEWLHWAFTPYALYTAFGVVVSYAFYNLRKSYTVSSAMYPLLGERLGNRGKTAIDCICLFSILGGVAGSLGYGLLQLGSGLEYLFDLKTGLFSWILISIVVTIIYTGTSVSGLKKGIAWLSKNNTWLFFLFLAFAILFGPRSFMFNLTSEAIGQFVRDYLPMLTVQDVMPGTDLWPQWWNNIWWLDWIAFAPMMGLFMATLSRGRTIKEFVVVNMILPSLFAMIWFGIFGGIAAHVQFIMGEDLASVLSEHGHEYMQLFSMSYLPFDIITKPLLLITQMISFITLANSMTSTIAMMTIVPGKGYTSEEPPMKIKIVWGALMASIAILFLASGGLSGAKSVKAITGFPIFILELAVVIGFILFFVKGKAPEKSAYAVKFSYDNLNPATGEITEFIMPIPEKKKDK